MELKLLELGPDFDISDDLKRQQAQLTTRQIIEWLESHSQNWHPIPYAESLLIIGGVVLQELRQAAGMGQN